MTEHFFAQALERAQYLDEYLEREGKPIGPLHGLPISVKDTFHVKGAYTTIGYVSFLKNGTATENAPLVDLLLNLGAVLYVKTNIPQSLMVSLMVSGEVNTNRGVRLLILRTTSTAVRSTHSTRT